MSDAPGPDWWDNAWPGMLLRIVVRDEASGLEEVTFKRVPLERELQEAMDWAAKEFLDPTRPVTPPFPDGSPPKSASLPPSSRRTSSRRTGR